MWYTSATRLAHPSPHSPLTLSRSLHTYVRATKLLQRALNETQVGRSTEPIYAFTLSSLTYTCLYSATRLAHPSPHSPLTLSRSLHTYVRATKLLQRALNETQVGRSTEPIYAFTLSSLSHSRERQAP